MEDQIKTALADGAKSVKEIAAALGKGETTVRKTLTALAESGALVKEGSKYAIAPTEPAGEGSTRGRGRPKDPFVQARDDRALALIAESGETGLTVAQLAEKLEVEKPTIAYLSVWRLRKAGLIAKVLNGSRQPAYAKAG